MPTASISAYIVVGPTKAKPFLRKAFESALDSSETVGTSEWSRGRGVSEGWKPQTKSTRPPSSRSARVARALAIVAWILPRWRTMPASPSRRSTSASV